MYKCLGRSTCLLLIALSFFWVLVSCSATQDYKAILVYPERPDTERALDAARKPDEVLAFYGVKPGDKTADI